ncbi:MAG: VWA domain-containing protein [Alphaproteobacteria bacterium]|nr:VWA domain-containing protein [Alphaproteobacteria bacterium]
MANIKTLLLTLKKNIRGSMPVTMALAAVPLLGAAGAAIDYVRAYNASTEIKAAADAAVLAGTSVLSESKGNEKLALAAAESSFKAHLKQMASFSKNTVKIVVNEKKTGLSASGTAAIETTLLKLIGIVELPVLNPSGAEFSAAEAPVAGGGGDIEISMMLDVTGSMCNDNTGPCSSDPKLAALKVAASKLVDTVVWDDQSKHTSKVAVVPFNTHVRVSPDGQGAAIMASLTNLPATWNGYYNTCDNWVGSGGADGSGGTWSCTPWYTTQATNFKVMPCVTDRYYNTSTDYDYTDAAPGSNKWMNATDGTRSPKYDDSTDVQRTSGIGATAADPLGGWNYDQNGTCWAQPTSNTFMPLSNNKSVLKSMIDGLQATGSTGGTLGTSFTWFTLSPNWNNALSNTAQPYSKLTQINSSGGKSLRKIAILMTDGAYNAGRGWLDNDQNPYFVAAKKMCEAMKNSGIEIYTVGYELNALPPNDKAHALDVLRQCGSDIKHFYESFDAAKLQADFDQIAQNISGLDAGIRLTK